MIEEKCDIQFILTGSSVRKLRREGVDLLAGRAIKKDMHPFMASEIGETFDLTTALKYGMIPLVWGEGDLEEVLESYVSLYVVEEVQFEGLVRNIGNFSRFLSTIAFSYATQLNLTNVARECEVKRSTVENFLKILTDLLLAHQLFIFNRRAKRQLTSHPKFYFFDNGIFGVLRKQGPLDLNSELDGQALEGLVFQHLRAWCDYTKGKYDLYYWRTKAGLEVDFIVYGEKGFWAIEVKNSKRISSQDLRGLLHFKNDYPECRPFLLYRGDIPSVNRNVLCVPVDKFLGQLHPDHLLDHNLGC